MNRITVLLADDHTVVREGIRNLLQREGDLEVVGEARDGREAVAMVKKLNPAVVLMDISMPLLNGLEATRQVLQAAPASKVLILSAHVDDAYAESAAESGAMGFLAKQACVQDACRAIREVQKGKKYFAASSSRCRDRLNRQSRGNLGAGIEKTAKLTSREMEVLQLVAEGKANKETAAELAISIKTVEKHRGRLMQKLGIHDTASLTRYAVSAGVIKHSVQFNLRPQNARATACPLANSSSPARLPR